MFSGALVWFLVKEPVRGGAEPELAGKITEESAARYSAKLSDVPKVLAIPTIWVAILQGLAGSMPWVVMGLYFITWLVRTFEIEEQQATIAFAGIVLGTVFSNVIGGFLGDWAEKVSPKYGRTFIGQVSIVSGIPMTYVLLAMTQDWPFFLVVVWCFATALLISWPGKGAKEPMMQGTVPPELRATAFSMITFIESGFAALAAYIAGALADKLTLTTAMLWTVPFPWVICAALFSLFYWAYPRDSKKLREMMSVRAEEI
jgi:predicted MFS family arabinose efflux permease